ncbi:hypothetical protein GcC1_087007 [Golovinomyces cichoracearum]|uniref:Uncharacterized protein n=1 Tax=Golovinomyces cichoracearum TaxID=62708 RepID=A0A420IH99_9PEZI|nr:hypothetical protein GcC1_087007 [Golovinomyces cichoracearum]
MTQPDVTKMADESRLEGRESTATSPSLILRNSNSKVQMNEAQLTVGTLFLGRKNKAKLLQDSDRGPFCADHVQALTHSQLRAAQRTHNGLIKKIEHGSWIIICLV